MKYYCYNNKEKDKVDVWSEEGLLNVFYEDWANNMVKKLMGNTTYFEANYTKQDFIDDWVYENSAVEID
jgi:hypothetical protein